MMNKKLLQITLAATFLLTGYGQPTTSAMAAVLVNPGSSFETAPCPFDIPEGAMVECGFVVVPEDHNNPAGPTIRIAVAVLIAVLVFVPIFVRAIRWYVGILVPVLVPILVRVVGSVVADRQILDIHVDLKASIICWIGPVKWREGY